MKKAPLGPRELGQPWWSSNMTWPNGRFGDGEPEVFQVNLCAGFQKRKLCCKWLKGEVWNKIRHFFVKSVLSCSFLCPFPIMVWSMTSWFEWEGAISSVAGWWVAQLWGIKFDAKIYGKFEGFSRKNSAAFGWGQLMTPDSLYYSVSTIPTVV